MLRLIGKIFFKIMGWKVATGFPKNIKKGVIVAAPHTSNWDLIFARMALAILEVPVKFTIKQEWLKTPVGPLLKYLGAIPIDRSIKKEEKKVSKVEEMTKYLKSNDELFIIVTPEGTRGYSARWRTGFYYVALNAKVPFLLGYLDYKNKHAGIGPVIYPTGNIDSDIQVIKDFYKNITPKYLDKGVK